MGYVCCCADCVVSRGRLGIEDCAEVLDGGRRRGTFTSVKDLISAIENFIDGWNTRCTPFT